MLSHLNSELFMKDFLAFIPAGNGIDRVLLIVTPNPASPQDAPKPELSLLRFPEMPDDLGQDSVRCLQMGESSSCLLDRASEHPLRKLPPLFGSS